MSTKQPATAEQIIDVIIAQRLSHRKDFAADDDLILLLHPADAMTIIYDVPVVRDQHLATSVRTLMGMPFITTPACASGEPQVLRRAR